MLLKIDPRFIDEEESIDVCGRIADDFSVDGAGEGIEPDNSQADLLHPSWDAKRKRAVFKKGVTREDFRQPGALEAQANKHRAELEEQAQRHQEALMTLNESMSREMQVLLDLVSEMETDHAQELRAEEAKYEAAVNVQVQELKAEHEAHVVGCS